MCDGCEQSPLMGTRYKCKSCRDFDLCAPCHDKRSGASPAGEGQDEDLAKTPAANVCHPSHTFEQIEEPIKLPKVP